MADVVYVYYSQLDIVNYKLPSITVTSCDYLYLL